MERVVVDLSRQFRSRGWKVRTIFPQTDNSAELLAWAHAQGVEEETHSAVLDAAALHPERDIYKLISLMRSIRPDVVSLHYGSNFLSMEDTLAARLAGVSRLFVTLHQAVSWDTLEPRKKIMTGLSSRLLCRRCIAVCDPGRDLLLEPGVPSEQIETIHCGVRLLAPRLRGKQPAKRSAYPNMLLSCWLRRD